VQKRDLFTVNNPLGFIKNIKKRTRKSLAFKLNDSAASSTKKIQMVLKFSTL
jgi:hypothetical protein